MGAIRREILAALTLIGLVFLTAGCAWRSPDAMCTPTWETTSRPSGGQTGGQTGGQSGTTADVSGLEKKVADLERRLAENEKLAEQANMTADKALKCCRKDYTVLMTEEIYFDFNKFEIKPESKAALDRVADKLKSDPDLIAELGGHCDIVGGTDYNIVLGQKRADAARMYLVSNHSINLGRLSIRTFGKDAPIATNDTEQGRGKNRRVTIDVLGFAK